MDALRLPTATRPGRRRFSQFLMCVLAVSAFLTVAYPSQADTVSGAQAQLQQSTASRLQAEQQLQAAKADVASVQAQLRANAQGAAALQARVTAVQRQAAANTSILQGHEGALLAQLQSAQEAFRQEQTTEAAQQAAAEARLQDLHGELVDLQSQVAATLRRQQQLAQQRAALQAQVLVDQATVARDQQASDAALVQLYQLSQVSALQLLFSGRNFSDGLVQVENLGLLGQHDRDLLARVAHERDVTRQQSADLQTEVQASQALQATLVADRQQIQTRSVQEAGLLSQLRRQAIANAQTSAREMAILQASREAVQQQLVQTQDAAAAQASQLRAGQRRLAAKQAAEQQQIGGLQATTGGLQQRVVLATQAEAAARSLLKRLTTPPTPTPAPRVVVAAAAPASGSSGINSFPYGQCTWWAMQKRPDLAGSVWGNAWQWVGEAAAHGRAESAIPRVGAIVVFQPGVQGADWYGHVGYVTQVGANGSFAVSEMNFYGWAQTDMRWAQTGWGVTFID